MRYATTNIRLDIGAWSIKGVIAEDPFVALKSPASAKSLLLPGQKLLERRNAAIESLPHKNRKGRCDHRTVPGEKVSRDLFPSFTDQRKIDQIMEGELADMIPFDIEDGGTTTNFFARRKTGISIGRLRNQT